MYSSTLSLTSALDGVGGQCYAPAALPPGKTRHPLYRRLGGPQGRSGKVRKFSPSPGFDPRTVRPVASRYTDWAIVAIIAVILYCFISVRNPNNTAHSEHANMLGHNQGCTKFPNIYHPAKSTRSRKDVKPVPWRGSTIISCRLTNCLPGDPAAGIWAPLAITPGYHVCKCWLGNNILFYNTNRYGPG